jgi:hypothetical protein
LSEAPDEVILAPVRPPFGLLTGVALLLSATTVARAGAPATDGDSVTIEVDTRVVAAARALGPDVVFFTSRAQPLTTLGAIADPATAVGTADVGLARPMIAVLRAGGVDVSSGAFDLMRLTSESHWAALFREDQRLRLFAVRTRAGRERVIAQRGGGRRLILRARGKGTTDLLAGTGNDTGTGPGTDPPNEGAGPLGAPFITSFGPLLRTERAQAARQRAWDAVDGARVQVRQARPGHTFWVVHVDRDLGAGLGVVSFLFGSGVVVKPAFERLLVRDATGARHAPAAVFAEGRTLELGYELPATARNLVFEDGDRSLPIR